MSGQSTRTVRLMGTDGEWKPFGCEPTEQTGESCTLHVPEFHGVWSIHKTGMVGNVGGNDWRIYTLHPDDCAALCALPT